MTRKSVCETVESHLWSTDSQPADTDRGMWNLRSFKSTPRCSTVNTADGTTLTEESEIRSRLAGHFEELSRVNPPTMSFPGMLTLPGMRNSQ